MGGSRVLALVSLSCLVGCGSELSKPAAVDPAVDALAQWAARYAGASAAEKPGLEAEGEALAKQHRESLAALIQSSPEEAIARAIPPTTLTRLPPVVTQHLERWVSGVGALGLLAVAPVPGQPEKPFQRLAIIGASHWNASVYGRRAGLHNSHDHIPIHGVVLDDWMAVLDSPLRVLAQGDDANLPHERFRLATSAPPSPASLRVHAGDRIIELGGADDLRALTAKLDAPLVADTASFNTRAPVKILLIPVDFSDAPGAPITTAAAQTLYGTTVSDFFQASSYGLTSLIPTVVPTTLRMPQPATYYSGGGFSLTISDGAAVALAAGYDPSAYDTYAVLANLHVLSGGVGVAGIGYVGMAGQAIFSYFDIGTTAHETGHNYGSWHCNSLVPAQRSPLGPGTETEYGSPLCIMNIDGGCLGGGICDFGVFEKLELNWFGANEYSTITSNGTYRLYALESTLAGAAHGYQVQRSYGLDSLYLEFRPSFTAIKSLANGLVITRYPLDGSSNGGSQLLDCTPIDTPIGDPGLPIGRTLADLASSLYITPIGLGGTSPQSIDVVVYQGPISGDHPPSVSVLASQYTAAVNTPIQFTATGTDADGDTIAYSWNFGDGALSYDNQTTETHSFAAAGVFNVEVTGSDMKGGTSTAQLAVTIGSPTGHSISGFVYGGPPLDGAFVSAGGVGAYTDSSGTFVLENVPNGSYTVTASKYDYTFAPDFTNPVVVASANVSNLSIAQSVARFTVSGTTTAGVLVQSNQGDSATADSNGNWSVGNLAPGFVTFSGTLPGSIYGPKTVEVTGNLSGVALGVSGATLSGAISGATGATVSNGYSTASEISNGTYYLGVPFGYWNITASLSGYTLTPTFSNPVLVNSPSMSGLNFTAVAGTSYFVRGQVTNAFGAALPQVLVSDGTRSSITDQQGNFVLAGVPNGTSGTITPVLAGSTFVPSSLGYTVSGADVTGENFKTTSGGAPPYFVALPEAYGPFSPGDTGAADGTTVQLVTLGGDDAGESTLTYTWSDITTGTAIFSVNGTNAAKHTTATFSTTGYHVMQVTLTDQIGQSASASVLVNVASAGISGITVTPTGLDLAPGASQSFTVQALDLSGMPTTQPLSATWTVSGGGAFPSGLAATQTFTAGMTAGGPYTVTATCGSLVAHAQLSVGLPSLAMHATASPNPVIGTTTVLSALGADPSGEATLAYSWSTASAPAAPAFSPNGNNAAKSSTVTFAKAGSYSFSLAVQNGYAQVVTDSVDVTVEQTLTSVAITPMSATVTAGGTQSFSATVNDQFGDAMSSPAVSWQASSGSIDADGNFTAAGPGTVTITATAGGVSAEATVDVVPASDLGAIDGSVPSPSDAGHGGAGGTPGGGSESSRGGCGVAGGSAPPSDPWVLLAVAVAAGLVTRRSKVTDRR